MNIKDRSSALVRVGLLKTATSACVWSPLEWAAAISELYFKSIPYLYNLQ